MSRAPITTAGAPATDRLSPSQRRLIALASLGGSLEYYVFSLMSRVCFPYVPARAKSLRG